MTRDSKGWRTRSGIHPSADVLRQALRCEEAEPERAISIYKRLEHSYRHFYADVALVAICLPTLGAVFTFYLGQTFIRHSGLIAVLILVAVLARGLLALHFRVVEATRQNSRTEHALRR